mmetsp:Transcript_26282/g.43602  ORF Transcript_26282/g.43602 Transcript_26282/m.43602 type:complete len:290 (-) Transcript_26282:296-1165(-)
MANPKPAADHLNSARHCIAPQSMQPQTQLAEPTLADQPAFGPAAAEKHAARVRAVERGGHEEATRSYSSVMSGDSQWSSCIDSQEAWSARVLDKDQWMRIDMRKVKAVHGYVIQSGSSAGSQNTFVRMLQVQTSCDGMTWTMAMADAPGVQGASETCEVTFDREHYVRYMRFSPQEWSGHISMRADVLVGASIEVAQEDDRQEDDMSAGRLVFRHEDDIKVHLDQLLITMCTCVRCGVTQPGSYMVSAGPYCVECYDAVYPYARAQLRARVRARLGRNSMCTISQCTLS